MLYEITVLVGLILLGFVAWRDYTLGTLLVVGLLPSYLLRFSLGPIPTNFFEVAVAVLAIVGLGIPRWRQSAWAVVRQQSYLTTASLLLFIGSAVVGTYHSTSFLHSLGILKSWIAIPLVCGLIVLSVARSARVRRDVILSLIFSGAAMAIIALVLVVPPARAQGIYDVPNSLALFLAPLFILGAWEGSAITRIPTALMALALVATQSLGALVAVGSTLAAGILLVRQRRIQTNHVLMGVGIVVCILLFLTWTGRLVYIVQPLFTPAVHNSASVRAQLWSISLDLIQRQPLWGVGLGQFEPAYQQRLHERFIAFEHDPTHVLQPLPEFVFRDPHNWVLAFWLNLGAVGLVTFTVLSWRAIHAALAQSSSRVAQAVGLALICALIFGLFDTIYWKNDLSAQWWVLVALAFSFSTGQLRNEPRIDS